MVQGTFRAPSPNPWVVTGKAPTAEIFGGTPLARRVSPKNDDVDDLLRTDLNRATTRALPRGTDYRLVRGVDPYYVATFFRKLSASTFNELTHLFKVKHLPEDLGQMSSDQWSPSGGASLDGEPLSPIQIWPRLNKVISVPTPAGPINVTVPAGGQAIEQCDVLVAVNAPYFAVASVWEEDGDQAVEIINALSSILLDYAGTLLGLTAIRVVIRSAILDFVTFALGSDDDPIGDVLMVIGADDLAQEGYREIPTQVTYPPPEFVELFRRVFDMNLDVENDWVLHFSLETKAA